MKNGTMFSSLTKYKSQSYYDEHQVLFLFTPDANYKIELIAGFVSKPTGTVYNAEQTYEQVLQYCSQSTFHADVIPHLAKAFNDAGIKVTVNEKTGELAMDSSVLFGGDSAVLTDEGKTFLNKFIEVYTNVVFSEKYEGFVSKTMVEGHTAPVSGSTYESGLPLSEERANNVKNYCVSSEIGVDVNKLTSALEAVGYSNSKPVTDANGNVDMAASRRVSFRFIINLEQL